MASDIVRDFNANNSNCCNSPPTPFSSLSFTSVTLIRYWTFFNDHVTIYDNDGDVNGVANSILRNFSSNNNNNNESLYCHRHDVFFIKTYLIGVNAIVALNLPLLFVMISSSARGSICDIRARRHVTSLLYLK
jgi:hypothetical protein